MNVLVTGASGFLGTAVVRALLGRGHQVVALVRPASNPTGEPWDDPRVRLVRGDLRERGTWTGQLGDVDAVVHLAAALSGDLGTQFQGTVLATEHLLGALDLAALTRFVHISSFSVYDFAGLPDGAVLDETSALEPDTARRDAYTTTKVVQERLVRSALDAAGTELVVVRPGAIYGPGKHWDHGIALTLGPLGLLFAPRAPFRLTYVDNCAEAVAAAVDAPAAAGTTLNVVDDDLPTHAQYLRSCRRAGAATPRVVPVPWVVVRLFGATVALADRLLFGGRAKLPEFAASVRQQARWKPLRYSNARAKQTLGWVPSVPFEQAVARTVQGEPTGVVA